MFNNNHGLTLLEILVMVGLFLIVFALSTIGIEMYRKSSMLDLNVNQIAVLLQSAQSKTIAGEGGVTYFVQFTTTTAQLKNQSGTIIDQMKTDQLVEIVPPGANISFTRPAGGSNGGTVTVRLKDLSSSKTITVSTLGKITIK